MCNYHEVYKLYSAYQMFSDWSIRYTINYKVDYKVEICGTFVTTNGLYKNWKTKY